MDGYFARIPFSCFKYPGFSLSSKRYHTAAKHTTSFFDSSFNHIRQNSQLQASETLTQGKRYPGPHPANAASSYLHFDFSLPAPVAQDDENTATASVTLKNPINIVLPFNQDHVILAVSKSNYHEVLKKFPVSALNSNAITTKLTQKKHLHTAAKPSKTTEPQQAKTLPLQELTPTSSPTLVEAERTKYFTALDIEDSDLTDSTFLQQQSNEILNAYHSGQHEKVNALYMAIKRNDIVPSRDVYTLVLSSISQRTIDDSLDEKLSTLLNVYQDLVTNKIKPDLAIYTTVIENLLVGAIKSAVVPEVSVSGEDFFKLAIEIFNASNCTHVQEFDTKIIDLILVGMNLYPGLVNNTSFMKIMDQQDSLSKNAIYYSSLINSCKFTNDSELAIELYDQFKQESLKNVALKKDQFIIYSSFISTLVATNEIALATRFLDKLLTSIKNYEDYESKVTMLLSSYLLSLSKTNYTKSLEILSQFNRVEWIPEFSYEFYSHLLQDSLHSVPYSESLKLYNYMAALPRSKNIDDYDLKTLLIEPRKIDSLSSFIIRAIEQNDKSTCLKMLKESFVRKHHFHYSIYPSLFQYLSNDELCVKVINTHGLVVNDAYEFLTFLTCNVANLPIFDIAKTQFFQRLIHEFSLESQVSKQYYGFLQTWASVFNVNEMSLEILELCSPLIIEFHDLNSFYAQLPSQDILDFKLALTDYFLRLCQEVKLSNCSEEAQQAVALMKEMDLMK